MWFYFHNAENTIYIVTPPKKLEYSYNEDAKTHIIQFAGGNVALTPAEFKDLKKLVKGVKS